MGHWGSWLCEAAQVAPRLCLDTLWRGCSMWRRGVLSPDLVGSGWMPWQRCWSWLLALSCCGFWLWSSLRAFGQVQPISADYVEPTGSKDLVCCHYVFLALNSSPAESTNPFLSCFLWNKITFVSPWGEEPDPFKWLMVTQTFPYRYFQHLQRCVPFPKHHAHGFTKCTKDDKFTWGTISSPDHSVALICWWASLFLCQHSCMFLVLIYLFF